MEEQIAWLPMLALFLNRMKRLQALSTKYVGRNEQKRQGTTECEQYNFISAERN